MMCYNMVILNKYLDNRIVDIMGASFNVNISA